MIAERYTYLFVLFITIFFPFLFSFTKWFDFRTVWTPFFRMNIVIAAFFIVWDILFTKLGVWGFHHQFTIGLQICHLPIEEILFFIFTPYSCLFTYYCLRKYIFPKMDVDYPFLWIFFALILGCIAVWQFPKLYTFSAFVVCSIVLVGAYYFRLSFVHFIIFYIIILFPFFICNGILTGNFLNRVVVYYHPAQNMGMRWTTIPVEDIFYGMSLLLSHVICLEYVLRKRKP